MADFDPYPDEETTTYEYRGSGYVDDDGVRIPGMRLPQKDGQRQVVIAGDTVALPDRIAEHYADVLAPTNDTGPTAEPEPEPEEEETAPEPDAEADDWNIPPDENLEAMEYAQLRRLAKDTPVDGRQGQDEILNQLKILRDEGEDALPESTR